MAYKITLTDEEGIVIGQYDIGTFEEFQKVDWEDLESEPPCDYYIENMDTDLNDLAEQILNDIKASEEYDETMKNK